jgi:hypothetical protein
LLTYVPDTAILQQAEINKLLRPSSFDLKNLQEWLKRKIVGDHFLEGFEARPWQGEQIPDLVALGPENDWDATSHLLAVKIVPHLHGLFLHKIMVRFLSS